MKIIFIFNYYLKILVQKKNYNLNLIVKTNYKKINF